MASTDKTRLSSAGALGEVADEIVQTIKASVSLGAVSWDARDKIAGKLSALVHAIKAEAFLAAGGVIVEPD